MTNFFTKQQENRIEFHEIDFRVKKEDYKLTR